MGKTLGGTSFVYNGNKFDYCYKETITCLAELCDEVCIAAGGTDNTLDDLINFIAQQTWSDKIKICEITEQMWNERKGREKLSDFSNLAIWMLTTDWNFYLQCDEIISERSFKNIRDAIEHEEAGSYLCKRYNLWQDPLHHLVVEQSRKPCSDEVIRLARSKYGCFGDAESLMAENGYTYMGRSDSIEIYHCGFIRDPVKHAVKARNMLVDIFGLPWDERIGDKFDSTKFPFTGDDLQPVPLPLPKFIQAWCRDRYPDLIL